MMKNWLAILCLLFPLTVWAAETEAPLTVQAEASILGDIDSGTLLFEQKGDVRRAPASLTKVMTLYLIYEALANGNLNLEDKVTVSERAWRLGGSKTFVKVGEQVRVEDLIYGIAVQSGNDACVVLAEHMAGSEESFVQLMNKKAKELGMNNTHFVNSNGLPQDDHYSSAHDLFLLAAAIIRDFPNYIHYSQEKQYTFNGIRQYNRNRLLWRDPTITGLKTGYTQAAGYCLVATSDREGQRLAAIILGAPNSKVREEEALRMLRYGNRLYETIRLYDSGAIVRSFPVWKGDTEKVNAMVSSPVVVTIPRKERSNLEVGLVYKEPIVAPVNKGDALGTVVVKLAGNELYSKPIVAAESVAEGGFFHALWDSIRLKFGI